MWLHVGAKVQVDIVMEPISFSLELASEHGLSEVLKSMLAAARIV